MKVLIACEFSGVVKEAFRAKGHEAWSCDLIPTEQEGNHIIDDICNVLNVDQWDLMIAHPPCTYLCSSGLHWNGRIEGRQQLTEEAVEFCKKLMEAPIPFIAMENPIGRLSTAYRKWDQIIQPYQFGHDASKATCLWLKNLPLLQTTNYVYPKWGCQECRQRYAYELGQYGCPNCNGKNKAKPLWANQTPTGQNKLGPSEKRSMERSITYTGIAKAMVEQWGGLI